MPTAKPDPELLDNDTPELTDEWFAKARRGSEVLPEILSAQAASTLLKRPGRPKTLAPKKHLTLRLDADVVDAFKATGDGWQSRINAALREHLAHRKG